MNDDYDIVREKLLLAKETLRQDGFVTQLFVDDALAALARIEAENAQLRASAEAWEADALLREQNRADLEAENARLREALEKHRGWLDEALAEVASYQTENARLREALADPIGYANDAYEREIARLRRIEEAARAVLPFIAKVGYTNCDGNKCRLLNCDACYSEPVPSPGPGALRDALEGGET